MVHPREGTGDPPRRYVTAPGDAAVRRAPVQVGRRQVDAGHLHAGRRQPPGDAPMTAGRVEDAGAWRQTEQPEDLGRIGVRVRVVDRLLVEVEVVVAEGCLHVERHAPSSPPVGSPACGSPRISPSMPPQRSRKPAIPASSRPPSIPVDGRRQAQRRLPPRAPRACRPHHRPTCRRPEWEVLSSSITYLRAPEPGPAAVHTTLLRSGRTAVHVRAVLAQDAVDLVDAVFVLGDLPEDSRAATTGPHHSMHRARTTACA